MITRSSLCDDFGRLGAQRGDLVMVHASVRAVGPIVGGVNVLVHSLLDVVGPEGTVVAYLDFEPFYEGDENPEDIPVFDKRIAHAARDHGVLHETLRNWPGAIRSDHPDAGVVAIGRQAAWITADHPFLYGYGLGSPFEKIIQANARVLMIGAPLDTITLLHHAEHLAEVPDKRIRRYRRRMPGDNGPLWIDFEEFDTWYPVNALLPDNCFEQIALAYLAAGYGSQGSIGEADSFLLESSTLIPFGVEWLERFVAAAEK
jgi:aminoglycoside 3-N-acetyltransferase